MNAVVSDSGRRLGHNDIARAGRVLGALVGASFSTVVFHLATRWVLTGDLLPEHWQTALNPFALWGGGGSLSIGQDNNARAAVLTAMAALLVACIAPLSTFVRAHATPTRARQRGDQREDLLIHAWRLDSAGWEALVSTDRDTVWLSAGSLAPPRSRRGWRTVWWLVLRESVWVGMVAGLMVGLAIAIVAFLLVATVTAAFLASIANEESLWWLNSRARSSRGALIRLEWTLVLGLLTSLVATTAVFLKWRLGTALSLATVSRDHRTYLVHVLSIKGAAGDWHAVVDTPRQRNGWFRVSARGRRSCHSNRCTGSAT